MGIKVEGLSELTTALRGGLARTFNAKLKSVVQAGADVALEAVKAATPVNTGSLVDSMVADVRKTNREERWVAKVGPDKLPHEGSTFKGGAPMSNDKVAEMLEFGASAGRKKGDPDTIQPTHFMARSFAESQDAALDAMSERAAEILEKMDGK